MKQQNLLIIFISLIFLYGCVSGIDPALPFSKLPEITVATDVTLVASPSHPSSYLETDPILAGTKLSVLGQDENAAWLLVEHNSTIGWVPSFYSQTNIGAIDSAFTFELLPGSCTKFMGAIFSPADSWISTATGTITVGGIILHESRRQTSPDMTLQVVINGEGEAVEADYVHAALTNEQTAIFFGYTVERIIEGSEIAFQLANLDDEITSFQAAFFTNSCTAQDRFTQLLPIGQPKTALRQPAFEVPTLRPTDDTSTGNGTPTPTSTPIRHLSDARTPTPRPTPTPLPTLEPQEYGYLVDIESVEASSVFFTESNPISNTVDGDTSTYWASDSMDDLGSWIELHLAESTQIAGIRIYIPKGRVNGTPTALKLQFDDGTMQTMEIGESFGWHYQSLPSTKTSKVRLEVISVSGRSMMQTASIREVQLFGQLAPPLQMNTEKPAISIRLQHGFSGTTLQNTSALRVRFVYSDSVQINIADLKVYELEKDIAGFWLRSDQPISLDEPDDKGSYKLELTYGDYLLTNDSDLNQELPIVPGWHSDADYDDPDGGANRGIIFPIEENKVTTVEVTLSQLTIGVLNEAGRAIRGIEHPDWSVHVCANSLADVSDEAYRCASSPIDRRGAAAFYLVQGDYQIFITDDAGCHWMFPVTIDLNESKQELVSVQTDAPDQC